MSPRAVIIGAPGSGKTTVGTLLAEHLGVEFTDTDVEVERRAGMTISDVFTTQGEQAFRTLEQETVADTLANHPGVVALGGGAVLAEATRAHLAGHTVVLLGVGLAEGFRRVGLSTARPLLSGVNPRATYRTLLDQRMPIYREVSTVEVSTDEQSPQQVAEAIARQLSRERSQS